MYTKQQVDDKVKKILAEVSCMEWREINNNSHLKDDLAMDSLDMAEVSSKLDSEFNLCLNYEDLARLNTVSDLVNYVEGEVTPIGI